jgi:hypothetical protein
MLECGKCYNITAAHHLLRKANKIVTGVRWTDAGLQLDAELRSKQWHIPAQAALGPRFPLRSDLVFSETSFSNEQNYLHLNSKPITQSIDASLYYQSTDIDGFGTESTTIGGMNVCAWRKGGSAELLEVEGDYFNSHGLSGAACVSNDSAELVGLYLRSDEPVQPKRKYKRTTHALASTPASACAPTPAPAAVAPCPNASGLNEEQSELLEEMRRMFADLNVRITAIDVGVARMDAGVARVDARLSSINARLAVINARLEKSLTVMATKNDLRKLLINADRSCMACMLSAQQLEVLLSGESVRVAIS